MRTPRGPGMPLLKRVHAVAYAAPRSVNPSNPHITRPVFHSSHSTRALGRLPNRQPGSFIVEKCNGSQRDDGARLGRARRSRKGLLLSDVARATPTSHAGDDVFEVGPSIGVLRVCQPCAQVCRVFQAFLQPVRQFGNPVGRAVAHFVLHRVLWGCGWQDSARPRTGLFKTGQVRGNGQFCRIVNRSRCPGYLGPCLCVCGQTAARPRAKLRVRPKR